MQNSKITIHDLTTNAPADIHISAGVNGLFVHPEGTGTHDGDCYAPILLEIIDGKPFPLRLRGHQSNRLHSQNRLVHRPGIEPQAGISQRTNRATP